MYIAVVRTIRSSHLGTFSSYVFVPTLHLHSQCTLYGSVHHKLYVYHTALQQCALRMPKSMTRSKQFNKSWDGKNIIFEANGSELLQVQNFCSFQKCHFWSSCKSLLASNPTLTKHFSKVKKWRFWKWPWHKLCHFQKYHFWKISDFHGKHYWHHSQYFPRLFKKIQKWHFWKLQKFCTSRSSQPMLLSASQNIL